jgi:hypothetical protein
MKRIPGFAAPRSKPDALVEMLFNGEVACDGVVETFRFVGHPRARRCYAWSFEEKGET